MGVLMAWLRRLFGLPLLDDPLPDDVHFLTYDGQGTLCGRDGPIGSRPYVTCRQCLRMMAELGR